VREAPSMNWHEKAPDSGAGRLLAFPLTSYLSPLTSYLYCFTVSRAFMPSARCGVQ
jgi:hypothetical protein